MILTPDSYETRSLDEWAHVFHEKCPDILGHGGAGENWLWFVGSVASPIAESVRREDISKAVCQIGEALKWLCCFVKRYSADVHGEKVHIRRPISEFLWEKYPGICYTCAFLRKQSDARSSEYVSCVCSTRRERIERRDEFHSPKEKKTNEQRLRLARQSKPMPSTLDDWAKMIRTVYGPAHFDMPISAICLHFIEEIGEVSRAIRAFEEVSMENSVAIENCTCKLEEELADVFSWIFGLLNKLNQYIGKVKLYYTQQGICQDKLPELKVSELARKVIQ